MLILRLISLILQFLPLRISLYFGEILGLVSYYLFPFRRKITKENLRRVFATIKTNQQIDNIAKGMAKNMGKNVIEFFKD